MENSRFKFRLWAKDIEMYFGQPLIYINTDGKLVAEDGVKVYEIDQKAYIVEQCTGLKDKNGKLIYEGDIILVDDDKCPIEWDSDNARYNVVGYGEIAYLNYNDIEVIGNIHENKELLDD